ncbi:DUF6414 family protein [Parapedobacter koreensis]|uniref:Uncharacterized protein n=1 Tax=Parapedobacter koreensis TaxID=332977 RepID=A0A1H7UB39_9SPHI|nr:hypothetical protein [Parapedobacter koreensis]SEL93895.1 hypothetical protein SAMN05421740_11458 [Parapedobacter koreensis]
MKSIKDLIYFDYDKAKSLNSQLKGGLISKLTKAIEEEGGISSEIGFDIKILKGRIGGDEKSKSLRTETIEIYHELLNEVEMVLYDAKILTDLNEAFGKGDRTFNEFLNDIPNFTYVKANGWSFFEDFERFKRIMNNFNEIQRLIYASVLESNTEYKQLKEQINELKKGLKSNNNSNNHKELAKLKAIERNLDKIVEQESEAVFLDESFVERLETFLNTFSPNRLNFRLAPFDHFSDFQILSNLKSEYLLSGTFDNIIYTYGSRPNIKLSVFGIITSCPLKIDNRVNLNDEYLGYADEELKDEVHFERAFRNVFSSFESFEKFFFVPSYPKISLSPIAIYREVKLE